MAPRKKLTPLQETEARRAAEREAAPRLRSAAAAVAQVQSIYQTSLAQAKDALSRSASLKGDHVPPARKSLKMFLQNLNGPNQPDDGRFEMMIEAPFKAPPKKKTNDRRF